VRQQIAFLMVPESKIECEGIRCEDCSFAQRFYPDKSSCLDKNKLFKAMSNEVFSKNKFDKQHNNIPVVS
jgi:hypothetical protein